MTEVLTEKSSMEKLRLLYNEYDLKFFFPCFPETKEDLCILFMMHCEQNLVSGNPVSFYEVVKKYGMDIDEKSGEEEDISLLLRFLGCDGDSKIYRENNVKKGSTVLKIGKE